MGEETDKIPKPMISIGGKPILWHIMKYFYSFSYSDFIILCGYKGNVIREFFSRYLDNVSKRVGYNPGGVKEYDYYKEKWHVTCVDTDIDALTAGRLWQVRDLLQEDFWLTYGDGLANVDLNEAYNWWIKDDSLAQVTAVHPPSRFGHLEIDGDRVINFKEKPMDTAWVNGGYFILSPDIFSITKPNTMLEFTTFPQIAHEKGLGVYKHEGFWCPMDTPRDKEYLNELWDKGVAPWKKW